jgi:hypothetical protein
LRANNKPGVSYQVLENSWLLSEYKI